jgi:hypothetical protein
LAVGTSDDIDVAWSNANYLVRTTRVSPWVQYSTNNGVTWSWFPNTNTSGSSSGGANIAISSDGAKAVYEPGGTGRARYATRSGSTWSGWTNPATNQPANGAKIVADLVGAQTFYAYVGTTTSRSTDGGANWTVMGTTGPSSVNWVRAVPGNSGHLLASTGSSGNGLWRSTNGGATWTRMNGAAVTQAIAVGVGASAPGSAYPAIYVNGTINGTTGFFRSDDQGATWITISDAQHQFGYVTVIQGDPRIYGRLYIGANGRGVLYGDIADATPPTVISAQFFWQTSPNRITFTFSEDVSSSLASADLQVLPGIDATYAGYDESTDTATFNLATPLASDDYQANLQGAGVKDIAGNAMSADFAFPFYFLFGDADHSRAVDSTDFNVLAANFGASGVTYAGGDFNYSGSVDSLDFNVLAANFGSSLPSQAGRLAAPAATTATSAIPFSNGKRIDDDVLNIAPFQDLL